MSFLSDLKETESRHKRSLSSQIVDRLSYTKLYKAVSSMSRTTEGHIYTPSSGHSTGLTTDAVVSSSLDVKSSYDVIVIGAGFAGLVAARDLSKDKDLSVLLLEARDRIGGRTWTAKAWGEEFEMGGTWIHW